ncbi:MAG: gliding motility-associated C-terminal domain-containing protein [Bacteroidota bacterium]
MISNFCRRILLLGLFLGVICAAFGQAPDITYTTPQVYTVNTPVTPLSPVNTGGAVPAGTVGSMTTFATGGFNQPTSVAIDAAGYVYVADWSNNQIKKIDPVTHAISVFAGTGDLGATNGPGNIATFYEPDGIVLDADGNCYVSDQGNNLIRKITPAGIVSTLAGSGLAGAADGVGASASFYNPRGLTIGPSGYIYVADQGNNLIRKISPTGVVTTFGSTGTFNTPTAVEFDAAGNLYVADSGSGSIKKITGLGEVTTFVTGLSFPREIKIDNKGNFYVVEQNGNSIKKISLGVVTTLINSGLNSPIGITLDGLGNIYIADNGNNSIKKITLSGYTIDKPLPPGLIFDANTGIISGTPTAESAATNYTITAYNSSGSSSTKVNITVNPSVVTQPVIDPPNISYATPQTYTVNTTIAPLGPINTGGIVPADIYGVSTFAGTGVAGNTNGPKDVASFSFGGPIAIDKSGNLYVGSENTIKKIDPNGVTTTFAGISGVPGLANGNVASATFSGISGIAIDKDGIMYVADAGNNIIRKITTDGTVSTFAGDGGPTLFDGQGIQASFHHPLGIAVDASGNVYVADADNNAIRKITPGGMVTTLAGKTTHGNADGVGVAASFYGPAAVAVDLSGNVYVSDSQNYSIRKITPSGVVTTVVVLSTIQRHQAIGLKVAPDGTIFFADRNGYQIYKIDPSGKLSLITGSVYGYTNGDFSLATFKDPYDLVLDNAGNIYVIDFGNFVIREISFNGYSIDKPLPAGLVFDATTGIITGTPTVRSPATDYTITAHNSGGSSSAVVNIEIEGPLQDQVITFPTIAIKETCQEDFSANASSTNPAIPINYISTNLAVATISSTGMIHIIGPGTTTIIASQPGDFFYNPAQPASQILTVITPVAPTVTISASANNVYTGTPLTFTASTLNVDTTITYQWQVNGKNAGTNSNTFTNAALVNGDKITCTILTAYVCVTPVTSEPITVTILPPLAVVVPNAFTPNGDGVNDTWEINGLNGYVNSLVNVYNRYGSVVFTSKGYSKTWDGLYKSKNLPAGTYYYIIYLNNTMPKLSGYVTIIR